MTDWEQQEGEKLNQYQAFRIYLETRSVAKCSEMTNLSESQIRRLMSKNDWKYRAAKFDASLIDEARQEVKRKFTSKLMERWEHCDELQQRAFEALKARDLTKASFKSLNEIYHSAAQLQLKTAELMKIFDADAEPDKNIEIRIVSAEKPKTQQEGENF